jgi:hypothetical protein
MTWHHMHMVGKELRCHIQAPEQDMPDNDRRHTTLLLRFHFLSDKKQQLPEILRFCAKKAINCINSSSNGVISPQSTVPSEQSKPRAIRRPKDAGVSF